MHILVGGSASPAPRSVTISVSDAIARARPTCWRRKARGTASPSTSCRRSRSRACALPRARSAMRSPPGTSRRPTRFLGYPWFVTGEVVHGDKRGRELGYPTANLQLDPSLRAAPRHLRGAGRHRRAPLQRRRELWPPADVRRRHGPARSLPVRFLRRSLRPDHRRRLHRLDPPRAQLRFGRGSGSPDG